jgi:hypothetical protein
VSSKWCLARNEKSTKTISSCDDWNGNYLYDLCTILRWPHLLSVMFLQPLGWGTPISLTVKLTDRIFDKNVFVLCVQLISDVKILKIVCLFFLHRSPHTKTARVREDDIDIILLHLNYVIVKIASIIVSHNIVLDWKMLSNNKSTPHTPIGVEL